MQKSVYKLINTTRARGRWRIARMIRFILLLLLFPFVAIGSLFIDPKKEYEKNSPFFRKILYWYTWLGLKLCRVKVRTEGMENVPQNSRFVLVGNHRSNWDPLIVWYVFRKYDVAFLSKESNFKVPVFGRWVRKCCFMKIDRENPKNALKTVEKASELMKKDEVSIGVYPEGTRNKENKELLPFHNSVFKIAQKADAPIVVIAMDGAEEIRKRTPWKRTNVSLRVCDVIAAEDVAAMRTAEIGKRVRDKITEALNALEENANEKDLRTVQSARG